MSDDDRLRRLTRRALLVGTGTAVLTTAAVGFESLREPRLDRAAERGSAAKLNERLWLGPELWANRLQDWATRDGRLECVAPVGERQGRTVAMLTTWLGDGPATLVVRTGTLEPGAGFSGFLVGTGTDETDPLATALVQSASGEGGGILCGFESDGQVRFREHTDERDQFAYHELPAEPMGTAQAANRHVGEDVELRLTITPSGPHTVALAMHAVDAATRQLLSGAVLKDVDSAAVRGGVSLVSSALDNSAARFWLQAPTTTGAGIHHHPERALGPIAGTLFTLADSTLKMTVQLMPDPAWTGLEVVLQSRTDGSRWRSAGSASVGPGFTALIRVEGWDATQRHEFRVLPPDGGEPYRGSIPAEPTGDQLVIASINCIKATTRQLNRPSSGTPRLEGEAQIGLYTDRNVYFPHRPLARSLAAHTPDLLVAHGDQLYENSPTPKDTSAAPELDFLYKYLLWLWSFRDLTRRIPTVVLVDDHDVYQRNVWGEGGVAAADGLTTSGGYVNTPEWVNLIQRVESGHNPDPYDPTPVEQGISVYYGAFRYGGVSFALIEDRKFKTGPDRVDDAGHRIPVDQRQLLGERQETFLRAWKDMHPGMPKVVLTQTAWASVQTTIRGRPIFDVDCGGWPPRARRRALELVKAAGAIILSGDQHLGTLIRHGLDTYTDGPLQFTAPSGGTTWQRWFEPAHPLANPTGTPHTGDWTDGHGNRFRMLAVANPAITRAQYRAAYPAKDFSLGDRALKKEGYGLVRVDHAERRFRLECWPWDTDPANPSAEQYPGWPYEVSFDRT